MSNGYTDRERETEGFFYSQFWCYSIFTVGNILFLSWVGFLEFNDFFSSPFFFSLKTKIFGSFFRNSFAALLVAII
jgi:hypothetical protein